jgi:hypothetical protein
LQLKHAQAITRVCYYAALEEKGVATVATQTCPSDNFLIE